MFITASIKSLQQPANLGGLRRGNEGAAVEGLDPSFLGCAMSVRHR